MVVSDGGCGTAACVCGGVGVIVVVGDSSDVLVEVGTVVMAVVGLHGNQAGGGAENEAVVW
jgi:hypothetical protein